MNYAADINATDQSGRTVLHYLLVERSRNTEVMVELLIKNGINVNVSADEKGRNTWHYLKRKYVRDDEAAIENMF